jgi:hypothetical protein
MESQRVRNGLLFVIALCLVLIVLRLYSVDLVREAHAIPAPTGSYLYACVAGEDCRDLDDWKPLRMLEDGNLLVR